MVEFISEAAEKAESDEPPPDPAEVSKQESLEELVEAEAEDLETKPSEQEYIDDSSPAEYTHSNEMSIADAPELKQQIRSLTYVENGTPVVVDIFELYGKIQPEDDKSWAKKSF